MRSRLWHPAPGQTKNQLLRPDTRTAVPRPPATRYTLHEQLVHSVFPIRSGRSGRGPPQCSHAGTLGRRRCTGVGSAFTRTASLAIASASAS
eukprot:2414072-Prymnesium_polylepis.1